MSLILERGKISFLLPKKKILFCLLEGSWVREGKKFYLKRKIHQNLAITMLCRLSYILMLMFHLDSWIKIDQLNVTCFIISLFTAQHVSNASTSIFRSLRLIVDLFHVLYCSGSMCVGVTVWFGWGGVVSLCRLRHYLLYYFTIYCSTCFEC